MKKIITVILEVESNDELMIADNFIRNDIEAEINSTSNSYDVVSITIKQVR